MAATCVAIDDPRVEVLESISAAGQAGEENRGGGGGADAGRDSGSSGSSGNGSGTSGDGGTDAAGHAGEADAGAAGEAGGAGVGGTMGAGAASGTGGTGGAAGAGGAGATGGAAGATGAGGWCGSDPTFSFVEGFEAYALGPLDSVSDSPWIREEQGRNGNVTKTWPRTGRQTFEINSFTTSTETHYINLDFTTPPSKLNVELSLAPDGYYVYKDFASFGLAAVRSTFDIAPILEFKASDHKLLFKSGTTETEVFDELVYGRLTEAGEHNYVRVEFDFCALQANVFVGTNTEAPLRQTVSFNPSAYPDGFFLRGGLNPTYFDDIVIWTPGSPVDRGPLDIPSLVISSFASPGSRCEGLTWDGSSLWMLDNLDQVFQMDTEGNVQSSFATDVFPQDLAWDGTGLWTDTGSGLVKLSTTGEVIDSLPDVHYWPKSGVAWDGQYFWVGDYNFGVIHKHAADGSALLNWDADFFGHPTGITHDAEGLWIGGSGEGGHHVYHYSYEGELLHDIDLADRGLDASPGSFACVAWDGETLWYSTNDQFNVYRLSVP